MPRRLRLFLPLSLVLSLLPACRRGQPSPSPASTSSAPAAPAPPGSGSAEPEPPPLPTSPTVVDLTGRFFPSAAIPDGAPRLASIAMLTEVHARPDPSSRVLGYLRAGAVVEVEPDEQGKGGCPGGFRKLKTGGFVCLGAEATMDLEHPVARASTRRPDLAAKLPYLYGTVTRGGPVYARLPSAAELKTFEPNLAKHLARWERDKESGATYGLDVWVRWKNTPPLPALEALAQRVTDPDIPWFLRDGGTVPNLSGLVKPGGGAKIGTVEQRNGVAFVESFLFEGRRYNVSTDLRVLPADRFRPIRGSDFHGYLIGVDIDFPFALVRRKGAKRYVYDEQKRRFSAGCELAWRSAVALTGKQKFFDGKLHYELRDGGYIDDRSAGRVDPAKRMPAWGKNGEKWLDVNVTKQVLVAYEGTKPVYATLVSTGEAGLDDPETTRSTRRGIFRIHTKYVSITMDSKMVGEEFELRDVPYVQYFEGGYALHGAYWHDVFGQPKSHGCINLAPEDARRLFFWTEPALPPGWHGVARPLTGTVLFVHP